MVRYLKKKTHEEYVEELKIKNPTVEVIGKYINSETKILHRCLIHDIYWESKPNNILHGKGCSVCQREKIREKRVKTKEEYISELSVKNPTIEVVGEYINNRTKIKHHCLIHDVYWDVSPSNALKGKGCKECMKEKIGNALVKTHDEYVNELSLIDNNIEVVGKYINSNTPIMHHCLIHDIYWNVSPNNIINGHRCVKCKKEKLQNTFAKSHEQYVDDVIDVNPDIEVIGRYINAYTPILHRCKIDGKEWESSPSNILNGCGCPQCKESKGERCIRLWLDNNNIEYVKEKIFNDCKDKQPLPFDFYLPNYNTIIEYQGQQHYYPVDIFGGKDVFELQQKHDDIKREYCKNNNIKLLEIPYYTNIHEELNNFLFI